MYWQISAVDIGVSGEKRSYKYKRFIGDKGWSEMYWRNFSK